jgi:signal transduction histidine kinase
VLTSDPPLPITRERRVSLRRLVLAAVAITAVVAGLGAGAERWRFGGDDRAALGGIEDETRRAIDLMGTRVRGAAGQAAAAPEVATSMTDDALEATRRLFDVAGRARDGAGADPERVAITIYDARGTARAWAGRPSDLLPERSKGPAALFVIRSPLGLRLVYVQPIVTVRDGTRLGSVAAEHVLSPVPAASAIEPDVDYVMATSVVPVSLRLPSEPTRARAASETFVVAGPDGQPLLEAAVAPSRIAAARTRFQRTVEALTIAVLGVGLLLIVGPVLDRREEARTPGRELLLTGGAVGIILAAAALFWLAYAVSAIPSWAAPMRLLFAGAIAVAVVATVVSAAIRLRLALRTRRQWPENERALFVVAQVACGVVLALLLVGFERLLGEAVDPGAVDLRHFSLHPWSGERICVLYGILLCHAALLWTGALGCVVAIARWRLPRGTSRWHVAAFVSWVAPTVILSGLAVRREWPVPASSVVLGAIACAIGAIVAPQLAIWYRRSTVVSRILALFMAFLLPALLVYPSVHFFVDRSTRRQIETRFAVEALDHSANLLNRLNETRKQIDATTGLPQLIASAAAGGGGPETAFAVWNSTNLARLRLTSAVELYDDAGNLVSRFALNFPEYTGAAQKPSSEGACRWDVFSEALPFGADERRMLHAQRGVCDGSTVVGTIIIHVVFDYRTLPFITSQSPYFAVLRSEGSGASVEGEPAGEVELVVYGWGLRPIYTSGRSAWPLDDALFQRIYRSRTPFWTTLQKENDDYRVYVANDRAGIYALGYQVPGLFEHLVRLAELTTLAGAGYVLLLVGNSLFTRVARERPRTGRALLREIRASFYRKLFLAFVLASIVPVLTLALVIRAYFTNLLFDGIQGEAVRTAAVAQRVVEEQDALLRRGTGAVVPFGDDVMVWISQLINEDVNIFYGPALFATSKRDLFASGLLPTRTPEDVYRAIILQRLPSFVSEDRIGTVPFMLAATAVRTGIHDAILTVPLAPRQQEVEREIDELDRGIHLAALFFILLGAAIGLSMAERIADPVRRLTRATGSIARGDFDARIAVRSSDELRRLVDAFNSMAAELKAQRTQLERTHRIEAWAEMARQVAHEIKNPLTPIQLSAEHLRRVHVDRGQPLGPVLAECVDSILGQVRLLRQIAAEFSSFASAPTARPAPVDPVQLVHDALEPYLVGLHGRIDVQNRVAADLPLVLVDRTLVMRALANVVENALHAMPGSGRLMLTSAVEPGFVILEVSDTGVGMDPGALDRVFEPYFSTKTTGTGLGLPIARRNIELNGGTIEVGSEKGRGTTVTIRLPVAAGRDAGGAAGRTA